MKNFLRKLDVTSVLAGVVALAVVEMVLPKVATSIVSVGTSAKKMLGAN